MATLLAAAALTLAASVDSILFERQGRIWQIDAEGKTPRCVTERFAGTQTSPDWDPEHRRIVFVNQIPGKTQIWAWLPQGTMLIGECPITTTDLTWGSAEHLYYSYSRVGGASTVYAIRRMGIYDGQIQDLVSSSFESHPTVTGNTLVWVRGKPGSPCQLWQATTNGRTLSCLLPTSALDPVFSPDGTRIAFISNQDGPWGLYLLEGGKPRKLFSVPAGATMRHPDWSQGGDRLVFETTWHTQEKRLLEKPGIAWIPSKGGEASWITQEASRPAW